MDVADLRGRVSLDASGLQRGVSAATGALGGLRSTFLDVGRQAVSSAAGFILRDVVTTSWRRLNEEIRSTAKELVDVNRTWQTYEAQLTIQLQSREAAMSRLKELQEFAVIAPGGLENIVDADITLQMFGLHAEDAADRWEKSGRDIRRIVAEVAAGTKASMSEIATWVSRFSVGDTGRAIMRLQELGAVSRLELERMGMEFDTAGSILTPLDEAMTILLQSMENKFGGTMDAMRGSVGRLEEELEDFMFGQKQLWGEPFTDVYMSQISALLDFLDTEAVQRMLEVGRDLWAALLDWVGRALFDLEDRFAQIASSAFRWGANLVQEFASGITGAGYLQDALFGLADTLEYWLAPGSPPRILPQIDEWGADTLAAWLSGWTDGGGDIERYLADAMRSLEPFLSGDVDPAGLREAFGPRADIFEPYVEAHGELVQASERAAEAREALAVAEEEGDEDAIAAARERLDLAVREESAAEKRVREEERRVAQRLRDELALTRAMEKQTEAIEERARVETQASTDAAARAAEAEARALEQARLQFELAKAETPAGQLAIWERELAQVEEGTAEWYQIATRIVQLQQRIRDDALGKDDDPLGVRDAVERSAAIIDTPEVREMLTKKFGPGILVELGFEEEPEVPRRIDFGAIGKALALPLWENFLETTKEKLREWGESIVVWATDPETLGKFASAGETFGRVMATTLATLLAVPEVDGDPFAGMDAAVRESLERTGHIVSEEETSLVSALALLARGGVSAFWDAWTEEWERRGGWEGLLFPGGAPSIVKELLMPKEEKLEKGGVSGSIQRVIERDIGVPEEELTQKSVKEWEEFHMAYASGGMHDQEIIAGSLSTIEAFHVRLLAWIAGVEPPLEEQATHLGEVIVASAEQKLVSTDSEGRLVFAVEDLFRAAMLRAEKLSEEIFGKVEKAESLGKSGRGSGKDASPFAAGTLSAPGGLSLVGEHGPELVALPRGSRVWSARETEGLGGAHTEFHEGAIQIIVPGGDPGQVRQGVLSALRSAGVMP